jgi:hypothetical protein
LQRTYRKVGGHLRNWKVQGRERSDPREQLQTKQKKFGQQDYFLWQFGQSSLSLRFPPKGRIQVFAVRVGYFERRGDESVEREAVEGLPMPAGNAPTGCPEGQSEGQKPAEVGLAFLIETVAVQEDRIQLIFLNV